MTLKWKRYVHRRIPVEREGGKERGGGGGRGDTVLPLRFETGAPNKPRIFEDSTCVMVPLARGHYIT